MPLIVCNLPRIVDVLEDLRETAEGELSELRKAEANSAHNFAMLKQSLGFSGARAWAIRSVCVTK